MVGEVLAGLSAFKSALDIAKGLKDLSDATARNAAVIELQEKILTAQAAQANLVERVRELEAEVASLKAWDADKERYELKEVAPGAVACLVKESMRGTEPAHWLCAQCYANGKKGFLQAHHQDLQFIYHRCQQCGGEIRAPKPPPKTPGAGPAAPELFFETGF
jgi:hypothetical protein